MGDVSHLFSVFLGDVSGLISTSIRSALDCSLNYARSYLTELLPLCVCRVVYLDFGFILVDDIAKLSAIPLLAAPEYYNANFTSYFISAFLSNPSLSLTFADHHACYFNTALKFKVFATMAEDVESPLVAYFKEVEDEKDEDG
ncbi:hypothetical protein ACFX13_006633 [Malus domestica]